MAITSSGFDVAKSVATTSPGTDTTGGSGGGVMPLWNKARSDRIAAVEQDINLLVSNESQYEIPPFIADSGWDTHEVVHTGISATGEVKAPNGNLLTGFAELRDAAGNTLGGQKATWGLWVHADIPASVTSGENGGFPDLTLEVEIDGALNYLDDQAGMHTTVNTQYGAINGQVLDAKGNTIEQAEVDVDNQANVYTDASGNYSLYVPSGQDLVASIAGETITHTFNLTPGDTDTADLQFGGVEVTVRGPGGILIPNVPVTIDGSTYWTADQGTVADYQKSVADHTVQVLDEDPVTVTVLGPANIADYTYDGASAVNVEVTDQAGNPIENLPVLEELIDLYTQTAAGSATLAKTAAGTFEISIGTDDPRYETASIVATPADGELLELQIELEESSTVTYYG